MSLVSVFSIPSSFRMDDIVFLGLANFLKKYLEHFSLSSMCLVLLRISRPLESSAVTAIISFFSLTISTATSNPEWAIVYKRCNFACCFLYLKRFFIAILFPSRVKKFLVRLFKSSHHSPTDWNKNCSEIHLFNLSFSLSTNFRSLSNETFNFQGFWLV